MYIEFDIVTSMDSFDTINDGDVSIGTEFD